MLNGFAGSSEDLAADVLSFANLFFFLSFAPAAMGSRN